MKCTDKERETCNVEKMGCEGCYYNEDNDRDINNLIEELTNVRPDELSTEGFKLFNKINEIIDINKELEEEYAMFKKVNKITKNITTEEIEDAIKEANKKYIPVSLVEETIEELKKYRDIAKELIEEKVVIADSDSLNYGRAEAHDKDIQVLEELLEKRR